MRGMNITDARRRESVQTTATCYSPPTSHEVRRYLPRVTRRRSVYRCLLSHHRRCSCTCCDQEVGILAICVTGVLLFFFFFQAEDGIRDIGVTGVQTCALPI